MKNLEILEFLQTEFNNGLISKLNSIEFNLDKKYPSQVSSHYIVINFDNLSIELKPFGDGTYQRLKIGYSVQHIKGEMKSYKDFNSNKIELNLKIIDIKYNFADSDSELIIICEDDLKHRFYSADYNTAMCGAFKSSSNQNIVMTVLNKNDLQNIEKKDKE